MKALMTVRALALLSMVTCALSWFPRIAAAQINGTVYTVNSGGNRSQVPNALIRLVGPSVSQQTVTDREGKYSFLAVTTNTYRLDAIAPGLRGSNTVTFVSGTALEVPVELKVEEWAALPLQFDPLGQFHYRHFAALDL